ncbi:MAG: iron ABC transporter permease [Clostridiales bacterium]|nr:iron ABC transporter permease [Clostridiales bacterium]
MGKLTYDKIMIILLFLLFCSIFVGLCVGRLSTNPIDVFNAFQSKFGIISDADETMETVLFSIRIPRVLASALIGAMLSLSGAVYQGVFKNPLVSPDILGVSSGASVGAAGAILLGLGIAERQIFAFIGGIIAVILATTIPKFLKNHTNLMLVLSGIIVGGFLSSLLAVMKFIAEEQTELATIVFWQMGSFSTISIKEILAIVPTFVIGTFLLIGLSWRINILSFGEVEAKTLGMDIKKYRGIIIICSSLLTAGAVSISGTIGWIGLVIPHLARLLVGSDHIRMMPVTIVIGAIFMSAIDTIARAMLTVEIPLSILTGIIGAPCYALLLYKQKVSLI